MATAVQRPSQRERFEETRPRRARRVLQKQGVVLDLYVPWAKPDGIKRELGFNLRIRDPRTCPHFQAKFAPPREWDGRSQWVRHCSECGRELRSIPHRLRGPRWRWVKVFVARMSPRSKHPRAVFMAEAETALTNGEGERVTSKAFVRFKFGIGGPYA